jgi:fused signal recognition particle receptor
MGLVIVVVVAVLLLGGLVTGFVSARRGAAAAEQLETPPAPTIRQHETSGVLDLDEVDLNEPSSGVALAPRPGDAPPDEELPEEAEGPEPDAETVAEIEAALADAVVDEQRDAVRPRFRDRLGRARGTIAGYLTSIASRPGIDDQTWEELEELLIRADVGVRTTQSLLDDLRTEVKAKAITDPEALLEQLKGDLKVRLSDGERALKVEAGAPSVWLFVGVNGVGKTTTIGKVAKQQTEAGWSVVMAAGDTFRAAAAEQLATWAERTGADFVRGAEGGDPSSVIFDAVQRAASRNADIVLADTAGRLHTKVNLMEELRKVRRVADKEPGKVTEVLLVLDATTGQNGLAQAKEFLDAVDVTGIVLTKLDGSAKGGIVLAIHAELGLPIKLVGLGETVDDLIEFDPDEFVEALFS